MQDLKQMRDLQFMYNECKWKKMRDDLAGRLELEEPENSEDKWPSLADLWKIVAENERNEENCKERKKEMTDNRITWKDSKTELPKEGQEVYVHAPCEGMTKHKFIRDFGNNLTLWENCKDEEIFFIHDKNFEWTEIPLHARKCKDGTCRAMDYGPI